MVVLLKIVCIFFFFNTTIYCDDAGIFFLRFRSESSCRTSPTGYMDSSVLVRNKAVNVYKKKKKNITIDETNYFIISYTMNFVKMFLYKR